jgi:hypothetical protein
MMGSNYRPNMMNQRFASMPGMPHNMAPGGQMPGMPPNGPPHGMNPGMGPGGPGPDQMNSGNQFPPSFMNSMFPGGHPGHPGNPQFNPHQASQMGAHNPAQPTQNQPSNDSSDVGEILALFGDDIGERNINVNSNPIKNEPTQCGQCKQQVYHAMFFVAN